MMLNLLIGILLLSKGSLCQQWTQSGNDNSRSNNNNGTGIQRNRDNNQPEGRPKECLKVDPQYPCPDNRIQFILYNPSMGKDGVNVTYPVSAMRNHIGRNDSLKIIIHGIIIGDMTPELFEIKNGK